MIQTRGLPHLSKISGYAPALGKTKCHQAMALLCTLIDMKWEDHLIIFSRYLLKFWVAMKDETIDSKISQ